MLGSAVGISTLLTIIKQMSNDPIIMGYLFSSGGESHNGSSHNPESTAAQLKTELNGDHLDSECVERTLPPFARQRSTPFLGMLLLLKVGIYRGSRG